MTFDEARRRYAALGRQRQAGQLSAEQFAAQVGALRVQDGRARWWQIDPESGGWLLWTGSTWTPGTPPTGDRPGRAVMSPRQFLEESRHTALAARSQRWWDAAAVFGGVAAAVLWTLYASIRASREGMDWLTPIIMVVIPLGFVWLRKPVDRLLMPLQRLRRHLPRIVLVGAGIAAPFVVAWLLYGVNGLTEYPYLRVCLVVGSLVSYAILRTPQAD